MRTIVFWGLYSGPLILGNYYMLISIISVTIFMVSIISIAIEGLNPKTLGIGALNPKP